MSSTTLEPLQQSANRAAWLEQRRKFIGGSDCAALFNEGYGCHRRLVMDKRGVPDDYGHGERTLRLFERGQDLEDTIAAKFWRHALDKLGAVDLPPIQVRRSAARQSKELPFMGVNLDRQIISVNINSLVHICPELETSITGQPGPGVLECKSANQWVFQRALNTGLPPDYILQMQHALAVTGYQWGIFAMLCTSGPEEWELIWFGVPRDEQMIAEIQARAAATWALVEDPELPLPEKLALNDKRCGNCTKRKTCRGDELVSISLKDSTEEDDARLAAQLVYETDDSLADLVNDRNTAKFALEQAEVIVEAIEGELKKKLGDRAAVEVPSAGVRLLFKQQKDGTMWDGKALDADHPELAAKYKKKRKGARPLRTFWI